MPSFIFGSVKNVLCPSLKIQALLAPGGTVGMCSVPLPVSLMPASHIWLNVQSTQTLDFLHDIAWSGVSRLPQIKFCLSWVIRLGWFQ